MRGENSGSYPDRGKTEWWLSVWVCLVTAHRGLRWADPLRRSPWLALETGWSLGLTRGRFVFGSVPGSQCAPVVVPGQKRRRRFGVEPFQSSDSSRWEGEMQIQRMRLGYRLGNQEAQRCSETKENDRQGMK